MGSEPPAPRPPYAWYLTIALIAVIFVLSFFLFSQSTRGGAPVPSAWYLTIALIAVIFVLLLFPSILAFFSKRTATTKLESPLRSAIDQSAEKPEQLEKVAQLYATSVDVEGIAASTRMTIATIALLIVGICLFSLLGLATYTTQLVANTTTNANTTTALTTFADNITQIISIVLGILGGVLSAAVGFYFGSQAQTNTQLAAKGLEDARLEVERQINAAKAAKKEFDGLKTALLKPTNLSAAGPETASANQDFNIDGKLSAGSQGVPSATITLQHSTDNVSWEDSLTALTKDDGAYQFSINESKIGKSFYRAVYVGKDPYAGATSKEVTVTVSK